MRTIVAVLCWLAAASAIAQSYPNRPVRVIVPWPPGQATDIAARIIADRLTLALGQSFVAENRPGAGGSIGTDLVAIEPPAPGLFSATKDCPSASVSRSAMMRAAM